MEKFIRLFGRNVVHNKPVVLGMIHVLPLPGTPRHCEPIENIVFKAKEEAKLYRKYGLGGVIIENMHDTPYLNGNVGPEVVSSMTRISTEIRHLLGDDLAIGIQILSAANIESLSVAQSSSADFIRVEGYVYSHIGDEGLIQSCAGKLLRHRKVTGADNILVWTDVKKKHSSHAITNDVSLIDTIKSAEFFHSDGIIVTGTSTGEPTDVADVEMAVKATGLPVLIGSGVTMRNAVDYKMANGFIIGSHFKKEGKWFNNIDENKLESFMESLNW